VLLVWVGLLVWMGVTFFWAIDTTQANHLYFTFVQLVLLYVVVAVFPVGTLDFWIFIVASVLGATIAATYGAYLFHNSIGLENQRLFIQSDTGTISPNHFAASLILPTALVMMGAFRTRLSLWKLIQAALALVLVAGIYYGASRAGFFSLGVMLAYFFWKTRYKLQIAALGLAAILMSFALNSAIWTRFSQVGTNGGSGRVDIWRVGLESVKQHWLTGVGVGGFPAAFDQTFLSVYQPFYTHWHRAPHNLFLESIVELGLIGLILMLLGWIGQFRMLNGIGKDDKYFDLRVAAQGAILGLFAASLFADIMYIKYTWMAFCAAALVRSLWIESQRSDGVLHQPQASHLTQFHLSIDREPVLKGEKLNVG
jgi:O-antigen ligase